MPAGARARADADGAARRGARPAWARAEARMKAVGAPARGWRGRGMRREREGLVERWARTAGRARRM